MVSRMLISRLLASPLRPRLASACMTTRVSTDSSVLKMCRMVHVSAVSSSSHQVVQTPYGTEMPSIRNHWNTERVLAVSLLAVIPSAFIWPSTVMDYLLSTSCLLHAHWGIMGVGLDYGKFLPGPLPKAVTPTLYTLSAVAFACLCWFNFNDVGVTQAVFKFWSL